MSTQSGVYYLGTFGWPIKVILGGDLTGTTDVLLDMVKPDGNTVHRDLTSSVVSNAAAGEVTFTLHQSEVDLAGIYTFKISALTSTTRALITEGTLEITAGLESDPDFLVVEDGTGLVNANSYASVSEGDVYHAGHLYASVWTSSTPREKAQGLIMATRMLNQMYYWNGQRKKPVPLDQALDWPRVPCYAVPAWGNPIPPITYDYWLRLTWPFDQVPRQIKEATIEFARELKAANRVADYGSNLGIDSVSLGQGAITVKFDTTVTGTKLILTETVIATLKPFGRPVMQNPSTIRIQR